MAFNLLNSLYMKLKMYTFIFVSLLTTNCGKADHSSDCREMLQGVPLATELVISLIILTLMKILQ
jgi:hypothetical protein